MCVCMCMNVFCLWGGCMFVLRCMLELFLTHSLLDGDLLTISRSTAYFFDSWSLISSFVFTQFWYSLLYNRTESTPGLNNRLLTLSPPSTTVVPYANSLYLDETPSNSLSHPDPSCLTLQNYFQQLWNTMTQLENFSRLDL